MEVEQWLDGTTEIIVVVLGHGGMVQDLQDAGRQAAQRVRLRWKTQG